MQWTLYLPLFLSAISLLVFWLIYQLLLTKLTHFNWQRGYLLLSVLFSIGIPFLPSFSNWLPYFFVNDSLPKARFIEHLILNPYLQPPNNLELAANTGSPVDLITFLGGGLILVYLTGVILKMLFFADKLSVIRQLIISNPKEKIGKEWLIKLPKNGTAFSFFYYIFLTESIEKLNQVLSKR